VDGYQAHMISTRNLKFGGAALAAAALALAPAVAGAGAATKKKPAKPTTEKVGIHDNYYEPAKLYVSKGSTIKWVWPSSTGDTHDVTLDSAPKGVKKFQSEIAASGYTYTKKLLVPGKYHIICSLHEEMTMDITVR
jgi:plastocyanin